MLEKLSQLLSDHTVNTPSVLRAIFEFSGGISKKKFKIVDSLCEMLFGLISEQLNYHLSGLKDYPKGAYCSLQRVLKIQLHRRGMRGEGHLKSLEVKDDQNIHIIQRAEACESPQAAGISEFDTRCVSHTYVFQMTPCV